MEERRECVAGNENARVASPLSQIERERDRLLFP